MRRFLVAALESLLGPQICVFSADPEGNKASMCAWDFSSTISKDRRENFQRCLKLSWPSNLDRMLA
jgi:hypothetical protein